MSLQWLIQLKYNGIMTKVILKRSFKNQIKDSNVQSEKEVLLSIYLTLRMIVEPNLHIKLKNQNET